MNSILGARVSSWYSKRAGLCLTSLDVDVDVDDDDDDDDDAT